MQCKGSWSSICWLSCFLNSCAWSHCWSGRHENYLILQRVASDQSRAFFPLLRRQGGPFWAWQILRKLAMYASLHGYLKVGHLHLLQKLHQDLILSDHRSDRDTPTLFLSPPRSNSRTSPSWVLWVASRAVQAQLSLLSCQVPPLYPSNSSQCANIRKLWFLDGGNSSMGLWRVGPLWWAGVNFRYIIPGTSRALLLPEREEDAVSWQRQNTIWRIILMNVCAALCPIWNWTSSLLLMTACRRQGFGDAPPP